MEYWPGNVEYIRSDDIVKWPSISHTVWVFTRGGLISKANDQNTRFTGIWTYRCVYWIINLLRNLKCYLYYLRIMTHSCIFYSVCNVGFCFASRDCLWCFIHTRKIIVWYLKLLVASLTFSSSFHLYFLHVFVSKWKWSYHCFGSLSHRVIHSSFDVFIRAIGNSKLWYRVGTDVGMEPFIDWYRSLSAVHFE